MDNVELREALRLTKARYKINYKELALRIKCNPSSFYNWLRGEFDFSEKTCSILEYEMREAIKEVRS